MHHDQEHNEKCNSLLLGPFLQTDIMSGGQVTRKRDRFRTLFGQPRTPPVAPTLSALPGVPTPNTRPSQVVLSPNPGSKLLAEALSLLGSKERETIEKYGAHGVADISAAVDQAYGAALNHKQVCEDKSWQWSFRGRTVVLRDEANKVLRWLDQFKSAGDVIANVDPVHIGLPWAGIRILLEVMICPQSFRRLNNSIYDC